MSTTALEIYKQNQPRRVYTQADVTVFNRVEAAVGEACWDVFSRHGQKAFTDLLDEYFQANRNVVVSDDAIYKLMEANRARIGSVSEGERDWWRARALSPAKIDAITAWLRTQGKPNQLSNSEKGEGYRNVVEIAKAHSDRPLDSASFELTASRLVNKPGNRLVYVSLPKQSNPYQKTEGDVTGNTRTNWSARDYARAEADRLAKESEAAQPTPEKQLSEHEKFLKFSVDRALNHGGKNHAEGFAIRELHAKLVKQGASLQEQYDALSKEVQFYERRALLGKSPVAPTLKSRTS
jgi:hypothetical protein